MKEAVMLVVLGLGLLGCAGGQDESQVRKSPQCIAQPCSPVDEASNEGEQVESLQCMEVQFNQERLVEVEDVAKWLAKNSNLEALAEVCDLMLKKGEAFNGALQLSKLHAKSR